MSSNSCIRLSYNAEDSNFQVFLGECGSDSPYDIDNLATGNDAHKIVFYRDDGSEFEVDAILIEVDGSSPKQYYLNYDNSHAEGEDDSILDLRGDGWEFTGRLQLKDNGGVFDIAERASFLVT